MAQQTDETRQLLQAHLQRTETKCRRILEENPGWNQNDTRRQVLERLWYVTASVMGLTIATSDYFTRGAWWRTKAGLGMLEEQGKNVIKTSQALVKLAWLIVSFSVVETALRKLYEALEEKPSPRDVYKVYKAVRRRAGITLTYEQKAAFRLFQVTRNSIHNNSVHSAPDEDVNFAGYTIQFKRGHKVEYAEYPILISMMDGVQDLMVATVSATPVRDLPPITDDPASIPGITPLLDG
ncbi:MAG: hypothetical protein HYX93_03195 [Chloroflexi bacterium]|nr:hypothetical protein [Chloroflexota bacterium]